MLIPAPGWRQGMSVEAVYERLAPVYDLVYGLVLQHGRRRGMARLAPDAGESILEIGVGTGLSAVEYPSGCRVVAIDLSAPMIARARARLARHEVRHVSLCRMDAEHLAFSDGRFDAVYAPYVMNVVPNPIRVAREMLRVCRSGGRIVLLNHFEQVHGASEGVNRIVGRLASQVSGCNWHLDLGGFLQEAGLTPLSIELVNVPRVSSVVVCNKP
jgi:phosphatidylethanolamine/phosphatidyl-N-methylethanolamine N-methyltransferase